MTAQYQCPVCGTHNTLTYYAEDIGTVESYYYCDRCGYVEQMCYSPYVTSFWDKDILSAIRHGLTRLRHFRKVRRIRSYKEFCKGVIPV